MIKFLDLHKQYLGIKEEIDGAIADVIRDTAFISGKYATRFEREFAAFLGTTHCIGVANGTDAIEIAIEALCLPAGSDIVVPGNSFIASSEAVTRNGHRVVFADVDPGTYTLTADTIAKKLTPRTKAVLAVHLYGHPCNMDPIIELCETRGLALIEDCAQAHGATYKGRKIGTFGAFATFSFYPGKNLGAFGDAGAITTNDESLALKARKIANHGRTAKYDHDYEGRNSRLDGVQAAILSVKLKHLMRWTARRVAIADRYAEALASVGDLVLPERRNWAEHVYHLFVVRTQRRDALKDHLASLGIETGIHYPVALAKLKAYDYLSRPDPNAFVNRSDSTLISLPIGEHLEAEDVERVIAGVRQFYA